MSLDSGALSDEFTIASLVPGPKETRSRSGSVTRWLLIRFCCGRSLPTTPDDLVAVGLKNAIEALGIADLTVDYDSANPVELVFTNDGADDLSVSGQYRNAGSGGLSALNAVDVSTAAGATALFGNIENLIQTAIDAAAEFGSV